MEKLIDSLLFKITEGDDPRDLLEQMTNGYRNALKKQKNEKAKAKCKECGYELPSYPGAYPRICPMCDGSVEVS